MKLKCRDSNLKVFYLEVKDEKEAIEKLAEYEKRTGLNVRAFEESTGMRIIGGKLGYVPKDSNINFCERDVKNKKL